jgi:hypothetical protein
VSCNTKPHNGRAVNLKGEVVEVLMGKEEFRGVGGGGHACRASPARQRTGKHVDAGA